jgi:hypothetical protein
MRLTCKGDRGNIALGCGVLPTYLPLAQSLRSRSSRTLKVPEKYPVENEGSGVASYIIVTANILLLEVDMRLTGVFLIILPAHGLLLQRQINVDSSNCAANITSNPYCDTLNSTLARCNTLAISHKDEVIACICTQQLFSSYVGYAVFMLDRTSSHEIPSFERL